jgi:hypothetical protein
MTSKAHIKRIRVTIQMRAVTAVIAILLMTSASAQMRNFDNRKEGTKLQPNSLPDFTLIAVHKNVSQFGHNSTLKVRLFVPQLAEGGHVAVEAAELQDTFHYYMRSLDSIPWTLGSWNVFGPWPTRDVIDQLSIDANNIGVLASYQSRSGELIYLPIDLLVNDVASSGAKYRLHFITGQDLQTLTVTVSDINGKSTPMKPQQLKCDTRMNPNCKRFAAGSTPFVNLDFSELPEGIYYVQLKGTIPNNTDPTSMSVALYHHP